jgi:hypothetical protein
LTTFGDDLGVGSIDIVVPRRPASREAWVEIGQASDGASLVILDNLTQFVPGSLNDDSSVRVVYDELQHISQQGTSVCVLAHTSDKRNQFGHASSVPLGTSVIRTVPRWFVYVKRNGKGLSLSLSGNAGNPWQLTLTGPTKRPRFEVVETMTADELALRRQRNRSTRKLDENAQIAQWFQGHPGVTYKDAIPRIKTDLGLDVNPTRISRALNGPRKAEAE